MFKKKGFTLIELLTVIAIIGILASIIIGNVSTAMKRGRDARRKEDMETLRTALEMYYEKNLEYPKVQRIAGGEPCYDDGVTDNWCVSAGDFVDDPAAVGSSDINPGYFTVMGGDPSRTWIFGLVQGEYLSVLPLDPVNRTNSSDKNITVDGNYFYLYKLEGPGAQGYKLMTKFEDDTDSMINDGGIYPSAGNPENLFEIFTPNARELTNP